MAVSSLLVAGISARASAQAPVGPQFRINASTAGHQQVGGGRSIAPAGNGDFVVVWQNQFGFSDMYWDIRGQRIDVSGAAVGSEFRVTDPFFFGPHPGSVIEPAVAAGALGSFVVAWWYQGGFPSQPTGIYARRLDATGAPLGPEFQVHSSIPPPSPTGFSDATVATNDAGRFVVAWQTYGHDGDLGGIAARVFDATGSPVGGDFQVATYTTGHQIDPSVDVGASGGFVVVWRGSTYPMKQILGQRFDAMGNRVGGEFVVSNAAVGTVDDPEVQIDSTGGFIVAWRHSTTPGGIVGRRYDAAGGPLGPEFPIAVTPFADEFSIETDAVGGFTVLWTGGQRSDVWARHFDSTGSPRSAGFRVDTSTLPKRFPSLAVGAAGDQVAVWSDLFQDGDGSGVYGRRLGTLAPAALLVDATALPTSNGNGVFEAGETVDVAPAWRNSTATVQAFSGVASAFTGPGTGGSPTYTIADAAASYGTVAGGAVASCVPAGDCYAAHISSPPSRPVVHWDATLREDLTPASYAAAHTWLLHVGETFADVPQGNPFYRFIETIVHRGVTGGCTATTYCPASATSRAQMAVFALVAREGAGWVLPSVCGGTPMFADVPITSPFCPWVEELARRGVVSGCGGGNYCPSAAVSREQMAVFVLRTLDPSLIPPACAPPNLFADVPESSGFCPWIEELANRGIVTGCGGGNYCPGAAVTREQMGVFIAVTFGLALYGP